MTTTNTSSNSLPGAAARQANPQEEAPFSAANTNTPISAVKLEANRQNAQKSTGARTEAGHQASSRNALKHGLTAQISMLSGADAADYQDLFDSHIERHSPVGDQENELLHGIVENAWKLIKARVHRAGIYEVGRIENPDLFPGVTDEARRKVLSDVKIEMLYAKDFKNLNLQENRVRREHNRDLARLAELQNERISRPIQEAKAEKEETLREFLRASMLAEHCQKTNQPFNPADFGFDFTSEEWKPVSESCWGYFNITRQHLDMKEVLAIYRAAKKEEAAA